MLKNVKPGDKLWVVIRDGRSGIWAAVKSVGRKWVHLECNCKCCIETGAIDGGDYSSPGKCYLSEADWHNELAITREWHVFSVMVGRYRNAVETGLTVEKIRAARKILGMEDR